jgi:hypothetical protein
MSQKVLELAIVALEITQADTDLDFMHATGAQPLPGTPSVAFLEAVVSIAKAKYMEELRDLSPHEQLELSLFVSRTSSST